jgi:hypothetical protein
MEGARKAREINITEVVWVLKQILDREEWWSLVLVILNLEISLIVNWSCD